MVECQVDGCGDHINAISPKKYHEILYLLALNLPTVQQNTKMKQICQLCLLRWVWHMWSKWVCIACIAIAFIGLPGGVPAIASGLVLLIWIYLGYSFAKR